MKKTLGQTASYSTEDASLALAILLVLVLFCLLLSRALELTGKLTRSLRNRLLPQGN